MMIHMGQQRPTGVRLLIESHKNIYFMTSHTNTAPLNRRSYLGIIKKLQSQQGLVNHSYASCRDDVNALAII